LRRTGFEALEQRIWKVEGGAHGHNFAQKHICAQWVAVAGQFSAEGLGY
jgi:hypothetical protein